LKLSKEALFCQTCLLSALLLHGCGLGPSHGPEPVSIEVQPLTVEKKLYAVGDALKASGAEEANTKWFFHCQTGFDTKEHWLSEGGLPQVELTVVSARIGLSLPVIVYLPDNASIKLKEHEDGHVDICRRVYATASPLAIDIAKNMIGKTFRGKGANKEEAREAALRRAGEYFCGSYTKKTADVVDAVSARYDEITEHSRAPVDSHLAVEQAFAK
jgi:hypothetical protein